MRISYSAMKTWEECKRKFYYRYVERIRTDRSEEMVFGEAYHKALERYVRHLLATMKSSDIEEGKKIVQDVIKEMGLIGHEYSLSLEESFLNYIAGFEEKIEDVYGVEMMIGISALGDAVDFHNDGAVVVGVIDKVYIKNGMCVVVDYKTGERIAYDKRQFYLYGAMMRRLLKKEGLKDITLVGMAVFPRFDYEVEFEIDKDEAEKYLEWILDDFAIEVEKETDFEGSVGEQCLSCPYRFMCDSVKDLLDIEMLKLADDEYLLAEQYFKLKAELKTIEGLLKKKAEDKPIEYGGYRIGYAESKSYVWDVERIIDDLKDRNMLDLLTLDSRKALKYDWIKEKALLDVKKSTRFSIRKA